MTMSTSYFSNSGSQAWRSAALSRPELTENTGWWKVATVHWFGLFFSTSSSQAVCAAIAAVSPGKLLFRAMNRTPW